MTATTKRQNNAVKGNINLHKTQSHTHTHVHPTVHMNYIRKHKKKEEKGQRFPTLLFRSCWFNFFLHHRLGAEVFDGGRGNENNSKKEENK